MKTQGANDTAIEGSKEKKNSPQMKKVTMAYESLNLALVEGNVFEI